MMTGTIAASIGALGLVLPEAKPAIGTYVPFIHANGQLLISGQLPMKDGEVAIAGQLGGGVTLDEGQEAAKLCALNILAQAKAALGDLDRIEQLLRLNGFVSAGPEFVSHPAVINGASDLMVEILGDKGRHTRIAVGCASLP
ncbi:MAG: RidA family protein, partial [Pseudomonadota bacterium]